MSLPEPYYHDAAAGITIFNARCEDVLPLVKADAILTDPPYGMKNDCDYTRFTMGPKGHGAASSRKYASVHGDDDPFDPSALLAYPQVILWGSNHYAARLPVGTTLVWIKRLEGGYGSFLSDAEIGWMKGGHGVYCRRDTSLMGETRTRAHPTQKPVSLMQWCVKKIKGDGVILDPYMGSGPIARACLDLGRRYIGVEIEERYCAIAVRRLQQTVMHFAEATP